MTLHAITADGSSVDAIDEGEGRTILIVPPGGGNASSWGRVARLLADEFRVVRVQRRRYARRSAVASSTTMATDTADVLAFTTMLPDALLVGHSSGAVAALEAALISPTSFVAMLLYEPPLATTSPIAADAAARAQAALDHGDPTGAIEIHLRDIVKMPAAIVTAILADPQVRAQLTLFAPAQIAEDEALDALGVGISRYSMLDLPTLLIEGEHSPSHLRQRLADLAAILPNVTNRVTLAGQDHMAQLTAPQQLARVIRDFVRLAEHPRPQGGFGDHVDQRHLAPAFPHGLLQAPQVARFGLGFEGGELDRAALAVRADNPDLLAAQPLAQRLKDGGSPLALVVS